MFAIDIPRLICGQSILILSTENDKVLQLINIHILPYTGVFYHRNSCIFLEEFVCNMHL